MSEDLQLPEVPEPKPEDPEDVSWALSTAEAMWARGEHSEGIKWVRRAAEAASEAEDDLRALELAKAAADLTGLVSRTSRTGSIDLEELVPEPSPAPPPVPPARMSAAPKPVVISPPGATPKTPPVSLSRPPAPLPSQASQASPGVQLSKTGTSSPSEATGARSRTSVAPASKPASARSSGAKKASRKSRENLDAEARDARAARPGGGTVPLPVLDEKTAAATLLSADTTETPAFSLEGQGRGRPELGNNDPTVVGKVSDLVKAGVLHADDAPLTPNDGERQTVVAVSPLASAAAAAEARPVSAGFPRPGGRSLSPLGTPAVSSSAPVASSFTASASSAASAAPFGSSATGTGPAAGAVPPATPATISAASALLGRKPSNVAMPAVRPPVAEQHDPRIVTSQAVRVVVWRDTNGVHVAPAGTVVSAITVDAVLVALEPNADLTAWLGGRERA